jgi:RNA polymerase sigma factor (sigma-70 family)
MTNVIDHLRRAALIAGEVDLSDGQLLDCFISRRDEAAVSALVRRHGPMVWGVCRRILRDYHDAEDAFQATFLVLIRKATSIVQREMVGNWLYGVAHQTALKARATTAKRQAREKHVNEMPEPEGLTEPELWHDLQGLLDQELSQLPDKYRVAIVLCDLQGKTRKQVARQLKIPEGTLSSRLTTARTMLAKRLARHGVTVSGGALAVVLSQKAASACAPNSVVSSTIKAATMIAAGNGVAGIASIKVAALTEGVVKAMLMTKLKIATAVVLAVGMLGLGGTLVTYRALAFEPGASPNAATRAAAGEDQDKVVLDASIPRHADDAEKRKPDEQAALLANPVFRGEVPDAAEAGKEDKQPTLPAPKAGDSADERGQMPAGNNTKLRALLQERLEALRKHADRVRQLYNENKASPGVVRQAKLRVYKAELELTEATAERVAVLEKIAKLYKEEEDHFSQLEKQGKASQDVVREARISRLAADIALEREKAKLPAPSK